MVKKKTFRKSFIKTWKVLNLYAGIGGNRKLWNNVDVTAVEISPKIAKIYEDFFPDDEIIVTDAHKFLLEHFKDFDFIWSSPPCPTHSRIRKHCAWKDRGNGVKELQNKPIFPDMKLYEEIIFLQYYFDGFFVVENVQPYYEYLIKPSIILDRHPIWANFTIPSKKFINERRHNKIVTRKKNQTVYGFNIAKYNLEKEWILLRNCVNPKLGKHILDCARKKPQKTLEEMIK